MSPPKITEIDPDHQKWKRRFQTQGFERLKDLPPTHKSHPQ